MSNPLFVFLNGQIYDPLRLRFGTYNATVGDYSLKIHNIQHADAGRYQCYDARQQLLHNYTVVVRGQYKNLT